MSTKKNLPFEDIITSTESCTLDMEYNHKENEAEIPRKNVGNILQKNFNLEIRSNLAKDERRGLKDLQKDNKLRVHEFVKNCGFTIVTDVTSKKKNRRTTRQSNRSKNRPNKLTREQDSEKTLQTWERKQIYKQDLF